MGGCTSPGHLATTVAVKDQPANHHRSGPQWSLFMHDAGEQVSSLSPEAAELPRDGWPHPALDTC